MMQLNLQPIPAMRESLHVQVLRPKNICRPIKIAEMWWFRVVNKNIHISTIYNMNIFNTYGHFCTHAPKVLKNMLKTHPPMTPSTVLFGEAIPAAELRAPSFVFPYLRPAKYPPTSLKAMQSHDQNIKLAPVVTGRWIVFGKNLGIQSRILVLWMRSRIGLINGAKRVGSLAAPMRRNL